MEVEGSIPSPRTILGGKMGFWNWLFTRPDYELLYGIAKETNESLARQVGEYQKLEAHRLGKASGSRIEVYTDKKGEFRWKLKSANHKILAEGGEGFKTRQGLEKSLNNIRDIFEFAGIDDRTREK